MSKKYVIAEVNVTADGAKVVYLSDRPGVRTTDDVRSSFIRKFETIDDALKEIEYANQCVVSAWF